MRKHMETNLLKIVDSISSLLKRLKISEQNIVTLEKRIIELEAQNKNKLTKKDINNLNELDDIINKAEEKRSKNMKADDFYKDMEYVLSVRINGVSNIIGEIRKICDEWERDYNTIIGIDQEANDIKQSMNEIEEEPEVCKDCDVGLYDRPLSNHVGPVICELAKAGSCFVLDPISAQKNLDGKA